MEQRHEESKPRALAGRTQQIEVDGGEWQRGSNEEAKRPNLGQKVLETEWKPGKPGKHVGPGSSQQESLQGPAAES